MKTLKVKLISELKREEKNVPLSNLRIYAPLCDSTSKETFGMKKGEKLWGLCSFETEAVPWKKFIADADFFSKYDKYTSCFIRGTFLSLSFFSHFSLLGAQSALCLVYPCLGIKPHKGAFPSSMLRNHGTTTQKTKKPFASNSPPPPSSLFSFPIRIRIIIVMNSGPAKNEHCIVFSFVVAVWRCPPPNDYSCASVLEFIPFF